MKRLTKPSRIRQACKALSGFFILGWFVTGCAGAVSTFEPTNAPVVQPTPAPDATLVPTVAATLLSRLDPPNELFSECWVDYSPTNYDPNQGIFPQAASIRQDLKVLKETGFTGLVTYSADRALGDQLPQLTEELGFKLIMGIWDPNSPTERENALRASALSSTVGYIVGNEGLDRRYDLTTLKAAMDTLRQATHKPVATTEEFGDYSDSTLLNLGDWVFPNAHPFYAGITDPTQAASWTEQVFADFRNRTHRAVLFKEVGLPTDGDPRNRLAEKIQADYFRQLDDTDVNFVYFESFDQPWKNEPSVEPFWGLFKADRTPKEAAHYVCGKAPPTPTSTLTPNSTATLPPATPTTSIATPTNTPNPTVTVTPPTQELTTFNVYSDANVSTNHFVPSGYTGDTGDISVNEVWADNPHSGSSSIQVTYTPLGQGPNACDYAPPCKWAGVYWQTPPNNWGTVPNAGFDLREYTKLTFWARSNENARIEFKAGGITGLYPDSLQPARSTGFVNLSPEWQQYSIDLTGADLSYVIGGFLWATNWAENGLGVDNPRPLVFYLDDIRFER